MGKVLCSDPQSPQKRSSGTAVSVTQPGEGSRTERSGPSDSLASLRQTNSPDSVRLLKNKTTHRGADELSWAQALVTLTTGDHPHIPHGTGDPVLERSPLTVTEVLWYICSPPINTNTQTWLNKHK